MLSDARWRTLRERCSTLDRDVVLVTPGEERPFVVARTDEDRIVVTFREGGDRPLHRDQFDALADRLSTDPLSLTDLPPGVGPYVSVLSLAPGFDADTSAGVLGRTDEDGDETEDGVTPAPVSDSPFVRSRWDVRRPPEEVHDDALLVADFLERHDATDLDVLSEGELVDLYVLLSDVQWGADELRRDVGDLLLDYVGPGGRLHGRYGSVSRAHRERRSLKDENVVLDRLDEAGVPREWVLGVDESKLDVVVTTTEIEESDVYDVSDQYHVQKTGVESEAKRSRLQGLRDRLDELADEEAEGLREEIDALEDRIDDVLATG